MTTPTPVRFSIDEAQRYYDEWRFNCGPGALCAVTGCTPIAALEALPKFRERGYTNPKMMRRGLELRSAKWRELLSEDGAVNDLPRISNLPAHGLVRVQWAGPWTKPGVPVVARYRHSHWIAVDGEHVFDINAMCVGGWLPLVEWFNELVPWLIRECEPKSATGDWWATHCWEVER